MPPRKRPSVKKKKKLCETTTDLLVRSCQNKLGEFNSEMMPPKSLEQGRKQCCHFKLVNIF